ncbi:MAG: glutathionylspermidine synthase family protein [Blastocatellales bacterium]|nr:glutathionylspermidine synthase family protein [Blastocatellales bacterium]
MSEPRAAPDLPGYGEFARLLYGTGIISDPWLGGRERFRLPGVVLQQDLARRLETAAERIAYLHHELAGAVWDRPELLDEYFGLTPYQKAMWLASEGRWHGIARVDLFVCKDGRIQSCEMNSDTPSGEAEAVLLNRLLYEYHSGVADPNTGFPERFHSMLLESHAAHLKSNGRQPNDCPPTIAIIYPTDLPEDLSMIAIYREWLEARGSTVVLGSPYNLRLDDDGNLVVLGERIDIVIRHYKTDWWGERETIWVNQPPYPDPEPLERELLPLLEAERAGRVTVVNPFGAVITQNKFSLALLSEHPEFFSETARAWIGEYMPETRRLKDLDKKSLSRREWVLKSVYGCEGDSVVCGPLMKQRDWRTTIQMIDDRHWIAQRFFDIEPIEEGLLPNYGVYVIGGRAAGFYTRLSSTITDYTAVTAPTYIAS